MAQSKKEKEIIEGINGKLAELESAITAIKEELAKKPEVPEKLFPAIIWYFSNRFKQALIVLVIAFVLISILNTGFSGKIFGISFERKPVNVFAEAHEVKNKIMGKKVKVSNPVMKTTLDKMFDKNSTKKEN